MKTLLKKIVTNSFLPAYIISSRPLILTTYWKTFIENENRFTMLLNRSEKAIVCISFGWSPLSNSNFFDIEQARRIQRKLKHVKFLFCSNSAGEQSFFESQGLESVLCSNNAFVDYDKVKFNKYANKEHDAIYLARITPFKKHHLASKITDLHLVGSFKEEEREYAELTLKSLEHAKQTNSVPYKDLGGVLSQAKTGLCLSREEGAMYASLEYLLAGIKVVSTYSIGGRDEFFDEYNSLIVENDPYEVKFAVDEISGAEYSSEDIRMMTIEKIHEHRNRFISKVQELLDVQGEDRDFRDVFEKNFIHKWGIRTVVKDRRFFLNRSYKLLNNLKVIEL